MPGLSRFASAVLIAVLFALTGLASPRLALAQGANSQAIHVLAIDSDDADEQADALTAALRAHVRETPGWTLLETTQSLSMLTAAFHCQQHPDSGCLERIGDKLKTDQLLWGVMSKSPGHQVTVEVHLWRRARPDQVTRESYSENMKESNDDSLRKIATQVFGKLLGDAGGTLVVHAGSEGGIVIVDGQPKAMLDHGKATLTLAPGQHVVDIRVPGFANARRDVTVQASATSAIEVDLEPESSTPAATTPGTSAPVRRIVGWSAIVAGGILIATGVGFGVAYLGDQSDLNSARQNNYGTMSTTSVTDPCSLGFTHPTAQTTAGCNAVNSAHSAQIGEITTFAVGGVLAVVGAYLVITDHPAPTAPAPVAPPPAKTALANVHVLPSVGPGGGSMLVVGEF